MNIRYEFLFDGGRAEQIDLEFNPHDMRLVPPAVQQPLPWTALTFHQCEGCPLSSTMHAVCPVARNLSPVVPLFKDDFSYAPVRTRVIVGDRIIEKKGALENGVSSLMGLIMATSGCPVLDFFRPMAFTHLPFANENETIMRAVSMYLMAQSIRAAQGKKPVWNIRKLADIYAKVSRINQAFSERIRSIQGKDANVNAVISLDLFAQFSMFALPDNWIEKVQGYFGAYLDEPAGPDPAKT
jgi:hypothetical protein